MAKATLHMAPQQPLQRGELERLWTWERLMVRFYASVTALMVAACVVVVIYNDLVWLRRSLLVATVAAVAIASILHLRERCPRCRARLKLKSGFMLPGRCFKCGVAFERPPPT